MAMIEEGPLFPEHVEHGRGKKHAWKQMRRQQPWKNWQWQQVQDCASNLSCSSDSRTAFDLTVMQTLYQPTACTAIHTTCTVPVFKDFRGSGTLARNNFATAAPKFATVSGLMNTIQKHNTQKGQKGKTHDKPPVYRMSIQVALGQLRQLGP